MRDDHKLALKKVKQQILAFCLRHNYRYDGNSHWTAAHIKWLKSLKPEALYKEILDEYLLTYTTLSDKLERLDKRIEELKAVQFWLDQNSRALSATVQALQVQKMTLSTLAGMNVNMTEISKLFPFGAAVGGSAAAPTAGVQPSAAAAVGSALGCRMVIVDRRALTAFMNWAAGSRSSLLARVHQAQLTPLASVVLVN